MAIEIVNIIKEKRNVKIKGKTCEDGNRNKMYLKEIEIISSPTVSLEALLFTYIVNAHEGRNVSTLDVPGSYLHANMPRERRILMGIRGDFFDIMCQVNQSMKRILGMKVGEMFFIY